MQILKMKEAVRQLEGFSFEQGLSYRVLIVFQTGDGKTLCVSADSKKDPIDRFQANDWENLIIKNCEDYSWPGPYRLLSIQITFYTDPDSALSDYYTIESTNLSGFDRLVIHQGLLAEYLLNKEEQRQIQTPKDVICITQKVKNDKMSKLQSIRNPNPKKLTLAMSNMVHSIFHCF